MFTNTLHVFINAIPQWSLATVAPSTPFVESRLLYRREDFSVNKPILQESIHHVDSVSAEKQSAWSLVSHRLQLGKIKQHKGGRLSYFERGLLVGLALSLIAISGTGIGIYRGILHFSKRP
ncbi:hypothetical protein LB505_014510 [Fusarium chuoi]|nr:hypothetical protein LB505_014510 [Fusarium chuoi]